MRSKLNQWSIVAWALLNYACVALSQVQDGKASLPKNGSVHSEVYSVDMNGCPIEFISKQGGKSARASTDTSHGGYWHGDYHYKFNLAISFRCYKEPVTHRCPEELNIGIDDPRTLRLIGAARYNDIHPLYKQSAAVIYLLTENPPRRYQLLFCVGDQERTLVGDALVGDERLAFTAEVLRIVASIRFTDTQQRSTK